MMFGNLSEKKEVKKISKLKICCDLDNVLNTLTSTLIEIYNKDYNDNLILEFNITGLDDVINILSGNEKFIKNKELY